MRSFPVSLCLALAPVAVSAAPERPNIVLILADDLGYGDIGAFNPESRIPTPHIDRLAREGMLFSDAHAPGSWCVPTRYGLLTGRYPFRSPLRWRAEAVIEHGRATVASVLRGAGYRTCMVGKWHLGFDGGIEFDYAKPLGGGPIDRGFDEYFGMHASLDIPPYFYIRGDRATAPASGRIAAKNTDGWTAIQGEFWRAGAIAPDFEHAQVLPRFETEALAFIDRHVERERNRPFFLYLALTAPHTPWLPLDEFAGKSGASMYGDFVAQVDASVGKVVAALGRHGLARDTLVVFTSDNGPTWYPDDERRFGHRAAYIYRGMKGDAWEGGHRMPFIARWPALVRAGSSSAQTISLVDLFATFAALAGAELAEDSAEDSVDLTPILRGEEPAQPIREATIVQSSRGFLAIRSGDWKLIPGLGSGGFTRPAVIPAEPGGPSAQLYKLDEDPSETENRCLEAPEVVERLTAMLDRIRAEGRSRKRKRRRRRRRNRSRMPEPEPEPDAGTGCRSRMPEPDAGAGCRSRMPEPGPEPLGGPFGSGVGNRESFFLMDGVRAR